MLVAWAGSAPGEHRGATLVGQVFAQPTIECVNRLQGIALERGEIDVEKTLVVFGIAERDHPFHAQHAEPRGHFSQRAAVDMV